MNAAARMPHSIKHILKEMQQIAPCIVAGGAVRDTLNGRYVKDVDIFMDSAHYKTFTRQVSHGEWRLLGSDETEYRLANVVSKVFENTRGYDYPVQVVFTTTDPEEYVTRYFDFGICKAWYDGTRIHCHKDFVRDVNNKTITMCMDDKSLHRAYSNVPYALKHMQAHAQRIQQKYSSHRLVMPGV